ncbi:hypothetical protein [Acidithiobacillus sp.]|nr:hypothetical protein [Acidithiobacillus sp.]
MSRERAHIHGHDQRPKSVGGVPLQLAMQAAGPERIGGVHHG